MRVHVCGARGSTPAPGPEFVRYGGHTSSLAFAHDEAVPTLVLDAGTGLRRVTALLGGRPFQGTILLSHLHWDHVHGLPFFEGGTGPGHRVDVRLPAVDGDAEGTLAKGLSPPHFPVGPGELGDGWTFSDLLEGTELVEGFTVLTREIPHKGGRTLGFRVEDGQHRVAYLSDHFPLGLGPGDDGLGARHESALELADHVDVLVHDAQFLAAQFPAVAYLGHAAIEYAIGLAVQAEAATLLLFHHSPTRTDDELDAVRELVRDAPLPVVVAVEGAELQLP